MIPRGAYFGSVILETGEKRKEKELGQELRNNRRGKRSRGELIFLLGRYSAGKKVSIKVRPRSQTRF